MALPREPPISSNGNGLGRNLGSERGIDFQCNSERSPKPKTELHHETKNPAAGGTARGAKRHDAAGQQHEGKGTQLAPQAQESRQQFDANSDAIQHGHVEPGGAVLDKSSALPVLVREWDRNAREVVRVALDRFNGRPTVNVRVWYRDGTDLKPSKSGITLSVKHLPALAESLNAALARAGELGLLDDGGEQ